ncbi:MAG: L-aspartate oxidase [Opitutales bacterium]
MKHFDCIVVGSGIAGLSFALKMAGRGYAVAIITKKNRAESNTNYAQGGIAAVTSDSDDFELHVQDTLNAGAGLCDEAVVRRIVADGPERIRELAQMGVDFTHLTDGRVSLHKEGGHSKRRILHVKDMTGAAIEQALLAAIDAHPKIEMHEHMLAIDLITRRKLARAGMSLASGPDQVLGLYAYDRQRKRVVTYKSPVVMLATGGAGQIYLYTTNPDIATGDGVAIAYRAGAEVRNLEFVQFHPTSLYTTTQERFLISEAVRGEGAVLRNLKGEAFMEGYDPRRDLAPRDIVARAIDAEMKKSGAPHMLLDITHRGEAELRELFPTIFEGCLKHGINIANEPIPVVPACHYFCGGVRTDLEAKTDLPGLYACGEVSCTGLHGANRLASNSLLEACVLAHNGADAADDYLKKRAPRNGFQLPAWIDGDFRDADERVVLTHNWDELKRIMWDYVSIVRTTKRLERARTRIQMLAREVNDYYWNFKVEPALIELRNMIQVAELVVTCALQRKESRGLHCTLDYESDREKPHDSTVRLRFTEPSAHADPVAVGH